MIWLVQAFPFIHTGFKVGCGSGRCTRGSVSWECSSGVRGTEALLGSLKEKNQCFKLGCSIQFILGTLYITYTISYWSVNYPSAYSNFDSGWNMEKGQMTDFFHILREEKKG